MAKNNNLRPLREQKGWSQARLAKEMGVPDRGTIGRWERGVHIPSGYYQEKLAQLLNVNRDELGFIPNRYIIKQVFS
jgi:transcriptional regulator with XRE-family HTH domain